MKHDRRATDHQPLSNVVSRGSLDDRLASVRERMDGHWMLSDERWSNHHEKHSDLAVQLAEYKAVSNEWRATLADFRGTAMTRAEYAAEHKALETKLTASLGALDVRLDVLAQSLQTLNDRDTTAATLLNSGRNLILLAVAVVGVSLAVLSFIEH